MVGIDLKGSKDSCHNETCQIFPTISQYNTRNHRWQISQCPYLPYMAGSDDNQEIGTESPDDGAQRSQILTEVEGAEQNIEAQHIGKDVPHILRQPQVIGFDSLRHVVGRMIRRCHLVGGHSTKQGIGPTTAFSCLLLILNTFLTSASSSRGIMTIENTPLNIGGEEISEGQNGKQQHCQHVWQALL